MKWHGKLSVHTHLKNVLVQNEKSHKDTSFKFLLTPLPLPLQFSMKLILMYFVFKQS